MVNNTIDKTPVDKNLDIDPSFEIKVYNYVNNIFEIYRPLSYKWICLTNKYPIVDDNIANDNILEINKIVFLFNGYPRQYYKVVIKDVICIKYIRAVNVFIYENPCTIERHISPCHLDVYIKENYMILKNFNIANIRNAGRISSFYNKIVTVWIKKPESIFIAMDRLKSIQGVVKVDYHYF